MYDRVMRSLAALLLATLCWSQQAEFEVASVKPNNSGGTSSNFNRTAGGGLHAINVTLRDLIIFAYDLRGHQLVGGPSWLDHDRYDVLAKPAQNDNPSGARRSFEEDWRGIRMSLRAVLADRFQLAVHSETREMPIYALMVAKGGPHLQPSQAEGLTINNRNGLVICKKASMKQFAERALANRLGRTVVDQTGLSGEFDFEIKYVEDQLANDTAGPDFLTAMKEQVGLILQSQKGPVEVTVVDRAEKAAAN